MSENTDLQDDTFAESSKKIVDQFWNEKDFIDLSSAYGFLLVLETGNPLNQLEANQFGIFTQKFHKSVTKTVKHFDGFVAKKNNNSYLVLFKSATSAVLCALKIKDSLKYATPKFDLNSRNLKMAISPIEADSENGRTMDQVIKAATQMCELVEGQLVISPEIKTRYERENRNARIDKKIVRILKPLEQSFVKRLMASSETLFSKHNFNVGALSAELGLGRAQLYRRLVKLARKPPNTFIREFKLRKALALLRSRRHGSISEVARASGFKSASHFSKCFMEQFGILPSKYRQRHTY